VVRVPYVTTRSAGRILDPAHLEVGVSDRLGRGLGEHGSGLPRTSFPDRGRGLVPGHRRLRGDARYEPLEHRAFRAVCIRLAIDLDVARSLEDDAPGTHTEKHD
jgi:hypothetical protein